MSLPNVPVILSPQAEDDFTDILQYTLETWGETQAYAYRAILDKALLTIQHHLQIGHSHPELSGGTPYLFRRTAPYYLSGQRCHCIRLPNSA